MKPIKFKDANIVYGANQPEYMPLPAQRVGKEQTGQINTCWKLTKEEKAAVAKTGKIWVSVLTFGQPLQPVLVSVGKPEVYDPIDK